MTNHPSFVKGCVFFLAGVLSGCSLTEESTRKNPPVGFIVTPPTSYTTQKGRNLGERYHRNLERLVRQLVQNPVTRNLQFANNLVSVGGIGFFTHSATRSPDERYLEVILGLPDLLDEKADFSSKVSRLFSEYGAEVLSILAGDSEINNDKEVAGFGLNFSWRGTSEGPSGQRVVLERMVVYLSKVESQRFLARQMNQEQLLVGSVVFVLQSEGAPTLLRYASRSSKPEVQPPTLKETAEKIPEVPKLEPKVREIELRDSLPEKKKEERTPLSQAPAAKVPRREEPRVETRKGPISKAEKSSAAVKEAVKDFREQIGKISRAEVKPVPLSPQTKAPKRDSAPQKEIIEDRISKKTTPPSPAQKEMKDRSVETPVARVKTPPAPPVVTETPKQQETPSKGKTPEATPVLAAKETPSIPSANEPKQEEPKAEIREKPSSKAKAPVTPVKEAVKDTRERIVKIPRGEIKPPPTAISPQAKAPKSEAPSQQEVEERVSLKKAPTVPAQKEIKDKNLEGRTAELKPRPVLPAVVETPKQEAPAEKKVEQLALKKPPTVPQLEKPKPKVLRGYIVQFSFADRAEAERWFSLLNQEGYVTSISLSGEGRPVRLRVGNFPSPVEAKNALGRFQKKGLTGLVVQLPN